MLKQAEPSMPSRWRSALWVLTMPLGYAAACATIAAGASISLLLGTPEGFDAIPAWRSQPGAAAIWLAGATFQLTLVGMVVAAPVAVPVMMIFRHRDVRSVWVYALAGALVIVGVTLMLHLAVGFAIGLAYTAFLVALGPPAGLAYWLIAGRRVAAPTAAPPVSD